MGHRNTGLEVNRFKNCHDFTNVRSALLKTGALNPRPAYIFVILYHPKRKKKNSYGLNFVVLREG